MNVLVVLQIATHDEYRLAARDVAGKPWAVRLQEILGRACAVSRVVVVGYPDFRGTGFERVLDVQGVEFFKGDPSSERDILRRLCADHDGVVPCPVAQVLADPALVDRVAEVAAEFRSDHVRPVLAIRNEVALTGGAFLDLWSAKMLRQEPAALLQADVSTLHALNRTEWLTWPDSFCCRLDSEESLDWAGAVLAAMVKEGRSGDYRDFDGFLQEIGMLRFPFWDGIGVPPLRILTVRCLPAPLFDRLARFLARVPGAALDVLASDSAFEETRAHGSVRNVWRYPAGRFSLESLGEGLLEQIRREVYDLCVVPYMTADGVGFENITPLGRACGARTSVWMDIFGRIGPLAGRSHGWDADYPHANSRSGEAWRRVGRAALEWARLLGRLPRSS